MYVIFFINIITFSDFLPGIGSSFMRPSLDYADLEIVEWSTRCRFADCWAQYEMQVWRLLSGIRGAGLERLLGGLWATVRSIQIDWRIYNNSSKDENVHIHQSVTILEIRYKWLLCINCIFLNPKIPLCVLLRSWKTHQKGCSNNLILRTFIFMDENFNHYKYFSTGFIFIFTHNK